MLFLKIGAKDASSSKSVSFLKGSLFDFEGNLSKPQLYELPQDMKEFRRENSETNVLERFGAIFFEYLYTMEVKGAEDGVYYMTVPAVKEESEQRYIFGSSMVEITSSLVHKLELVFKLAGHDVNLRKGILYAYYFSPPPINTFNILFIYATN